MSPRSAKQTTTNALVRGGTRSILRRLLRGLRRGTRVFRGKPRLRDIAGKLAPHPNSIPHRGIFDPGRHLYSVLHLAEERSVAKSLLSRLCDIKGVSCRLWGSVCAQLYDTWFVSHSFVDTRVFAYLTPTGALTVVVSPRHVLHSPRKTSTSTSKQ